MSARRLELRFAALQDQALSAAQAPMGNLQANLLREQVDRQFEELMAALRGKAPPRTAEADTHSELDPAAVGRRLGAGSNDKARQALSDASSGLSGRPQKPSKQRKAGTRRPVRAGDERPE